MARPGEMRRLILAANRGDGDAKPAGSLRVVSATAPVAVRGLTGIMQIACGATHNLVLTRDANVMAWGSNSTVTSLEHRRHCRR